jgi:zinc transporter ZupT
METNKSYGDKGIKAVAVMSFFTLGFVMLNKPFLKYWMLLIGAGYLYFALHKLKHDRHNGNDTQKAWIYIVAGILGLLFGITLLVISTVLKDSAI